MTEPRTRLVEVTGDLFELIGTRSADGKALSYEWGEPIGHEPDSGRYVYSPTITATDDGWLEAQRAEAFAAGRAAALGPDSELRRLSKAATPGPWIVFDDVRPGIDSAAELGPNIVYASRFTDEFGGVGRKEDAELIVAAVNYVRDSLAHPAEAEEKPDAV